MPVFDEIFLTKGLPTAEGVRHPERYFCWEIRGETKVGLTIPKRQCGRSEFDPEDNDQALWIAAHPDWMKEVWSCWWEFSDALALAAFQAAVAPLRAEPPSPIHLMCFGPKPGPPRKPPKLQSPRQKKVPRAKPTPSPSPPRAFYVPPPPELPMVATEPGEDLRDLQLCSIVQAWATGTNLDRGNPALFLRNYTVDRSYALSPESTFDARPYRNVRADQRLRALAELTWPVDDDELRRCAETLVMVGYHDMGRPPDFVRTTHPEMLKRLTAHLDRCFLPGAVPYAKLMLEAMADEGRNVLYDLGDVSRSTTSILMASPTRARVALFQFTGDGP